MKVLITGANGFIGSYLSDYLLKKGYTVVATARTFHPSVKSLLSGAELISDFDVLETTKLKDISIPADCIIHTATANDIISKNTVEGITLSAAGTKNILEFAIQNNIPRCMVFSTFQVYGTELQGMIDENSPLNFQNDYGLNHLYAEMLAEMYSRLKKVNTVSVRPSNVYGRLITSSFHRWNLVPGCFCKEAMEEGTITIRSSGRQMRNFVNLQNLSGQVDCILRHFPERYECYNLASSQAYTMVEMADIVKSVFERKFRQSLQIKITGTEPEKTNFFSVSLEKLKAIGFVEDNNYTPETEIEHIFNYLQTNKQV